MEGSAGVFRLLSLRLSESPHPSPRAAERAILGFKIAIYLRRGGYVTIFEPELMRGHKYAKHPYWGKRDVETRSRVQHSGHMPVLKTGAGQWRYSRHDDRYKVGV